jgi:hypothetical protein
MHGACRSAAYELALEQVFEALSKAASVAGAAVREQLDTGNYDEIKVAHALGKQNGLVEAHAMLAQMLTAHRDGPSKLVICDGCGQMTVESKLIMQADPGRSRLFCPTCIKYRRETEI